MFEHSIAQIPTVSELIGMSKIERFKYLQSIRLKVPNMMEITRHVDVSYRSVNNVFAGNSTNEEVLGFIVKCLNEQ